MAETARQLSPYGDLLLEGKGVFENVIDESSSVEEKIGDFAQASVVKMLVKSEMGKHPIISKCIEGGCGGISCRESELITEDESIKIVCSYTLKAPTSMFDIGRINVSQKLKYRYFTGHKAESLLETVDNQDVDENDDETVYKTETGKVYHVTLSCPSLKLTISEIKSCDVSGKRNEAGGKYYACEKCAKGESPYNIFITSDGDRYHYSFGCSGLKRTVLEVKKSDLPGYRACKRCRKE